MQPQETRQVQQIQKEAYIAHYKHVDNLVKSGLYSYDEVSDYITNNNLKLPIFDLILAESYYLNNKNTINKINDKNYSYSITFTVADPENIEQSKNYIKNIQTRKEKLQIIHLEYSHEHETTNFHTHVYIRTKKPLKADRFAYHKKFGFIKFKRISIGEDLEVLNYINKENVSTRLI